MRTLSPLLAGAFVLLAASEARADNCAQSRFTVVDASNLPSLTGTLETDSLRLPSGRHVRVWALRLEQPVCVRGARNLRAGPYSAAEATLDWDNVHYVQIAPPAGNARVGQPHTVTGGAFVFNPPMDMIHRLAYLTPAQQRASGEAAPPAPPAPPAR